MNFPKQKKLRNYKKVVHLTIRIGGWFQVAYLVKVLIGVQFVKKQCQIGVIKYAHFVRLRWWWNDFIFYLIWNR